MQCANVHCEFSTRFDEFLYGVGIWDDEKEGYILPEDGEDVVSSSPHHLSLNVEDVESMAMVIYGYVKIDEEVIEEIDRSD